MSTRPDVRLAADIGGTFTDIVLERGAERITRKVLTTAKRPEEGVLDGTRLVLADAGLHFSDIDRHPHVRTRHSGVPFQPGDQELDLGDRFF